MPKSVLASIKPEWCEKIFISKIKTIEVRKTKPNIPTPFKCPVYCTKSGEQFLIPRFAKDNFAMVDGWMKGNGKVIGEFIVNDVECFTTDYRRNDEQTARIAKDACLTFTELYNYEANSRCLYAWHISDAKLYNKPKVLADFHKCGSSSIEELGEDLCNYCFATQYGERKYISTPDGPVMCEGRFCDEAHQEYLDENFAVVRPPQSWCYVEEDQYA